MPAWKRYTLISIGWLAVALGAIGAVLPVVPTTPFLILALACFSKSSPRFHQMLLNNKWVGPTLKEWETNHSIKRATKHKAMALIVISFSITIYLLSGRTVLQLVLLAIAIAVLIYLHTIKEST